MTDSSDERIAGLHHVTSVASDPARNLEFYTEVLGLRFVKKTVNFDDPTTYHLYYGDAVGHPGTVLTFFAYEQTEPGKPGRGQTRATAFTVPDGTLDYWRDRFDEADVDSEPVEERFGTAVLPFRDHDDHPMELIPGSSDIEPWHDAPIPGECAIRGFHGVSLDSEAPQATADVLRLFGFEQTGRARARTRYEGPAERARTVDILDRADAPRGRPGTGTVHHIAFRTADETTLMAWRNRLLEEGFEVTEQRDRVYFKSIYFREPGGILFEIATDGPGFTRDETPEELGTQLRLPPWEESKRETIETELTEL